MSRNKPQGFQLKPKHLVAAVLGVCLAAIAALVVGVIGTFKPHDQERAQVEQEEMQEQDADRVEVWKPNGANSQGAVVLNPEALNQQRGRPNPAAAEDAQEQAERNPFLPSSPERSGYRAQRSEEDEAPRQRVRPLDNDRLHNRQEPDRPLRPSESAAPSEQAAVAGPVRPTPAAVPEAKPEAKIEPRPEPKAEPKPDPKPEPRPEPAPQAKPQQKEVIDNLF